MTDAAALNGGAAARLRRTLPRRLRAVGIHLGISLVIFAVAMYLILVYWYPGFHFTVDGGWQGMRIMVAVDLVLGPLLTLIIFNPLKARRLILFDLSCIGLIQIGAVAWGFYAIHSQHPVAVSHLGGAFHSVTAAPLEIESYPLSQLAGLSDRRPALVHVRAAADDDEETRKAMMEIVGGLAEHEDPFFFSPFSGSWKEIEPLALDVKKHAAGDPEFRSDLELFLAVRGGAESDFRFFPYNGRYGTCVVAFSTAGEFLAALACGGF